MPPDDEITLGDLGAFAAAAERARGGRRREGIGTQFVESGYGLPALYRAIDASLAPMFESAGNLQRYGDVYDPAPVMQQTIGTIGAPMVGPAVTAGTLGAGAMRRAAAMPAALTRAERAAVLESAPFPQYATEYPPVAPGELRTDPKTGKQFLGKALSPEAEQFRATREKIAEQMKQGYTPYFDPAKRFAVDPSKYPGANVDTLSLVPAKQETVDKYLEVIGAPETRQRLRAAYKHGQELGNANDWYFMGQLESEFVKELGGKAGREAFLQRFAVPMAATTSGNNPTTNLLMAHYLSLLRERGLPMPKGGYEMPTPVGGRFGMTNVRDFEKIMEGGGYSALGADQPKMHNFARSFIGDLSRAVMDEQMAAGALKGASPEFIDRARKTAFGLLERPVHQEAARAGVQPGAFQDVAWAGFKDEPGKPMIAHINDAIERTYRLTGMPREEIVQRGLIRQEIPLYGITAPVPTVGEPQ